MRIIVALVIAVLLAGCGDELGSYVGEFRNPHAPPQPLTAEQVSSALEKRVFVIVEEERLKTDPKAKPLKLDPELVEVARWHSLDMAKKNYIAHANPDGETTATKIIAEDAKFRGILGENLASQSYDKTKHIDLDEFAQRFVDSWLNSADHKANLAYAPYDRTGVGVAVSENTIYVTQLFASDLGLPEPPDNPPAAASASAPAPVPSPPPQTIAPPPVVVAQPAAAAEQPSAAEPAPQAH